MLLAQGIHIKPASWRPRWLCCPAEPKRLYRRLRELILASAIANLANYFRSDNPPFKRAAVV
jgi:hypothetical protein